jgi:AcrR family transcriptional regulator
MSLHGGLSDQQTERRIFDAARDVLADTGLTVSLDHISLKELIREAGVPPSAVYRRWPHEDLFLGDLVKELARTAVPSMDEEEIEAIERVIAERAEQLETPEDRDGLVAEAIRQLGLFDFETHYQSAQWKTYLALNVVGTSIPDDDTRAQVRAALAESQQAHIRASAKVLEVLAGLVGYRLRPDAASSFDTVAILMSAAVRGVTTMATSDPDLATQRLEAAPFRSTQRAEWSLAAMALASVVSALLEPDPEIEWDADRAMALREVVATVPQFGPDAV